MSDLLNTIGDYIHPSRDWTKAGLCVDSKVDMTPGTDDGHASRGEEVMAAKALCASCVVLNVCRANALGNLSEPGEPGIYGGLTLDERERLRVGQMPESQGVEYQIKACSHCGQDCVPLLPDGTECDSCYTETGVAKSPELFRNSIIAMIMDNRTYREAADRFNLTRDAVSKACRRWGVRSKPGPRNNDASGRAELAPCGTPAAIRRHQRREEPMHDCACTRPGAWNTDRTRSNGWGTRAA